MASNLTAMAFNLIAMASNLIAMASNLIATASNLLEWPQHKSEMRQKRAMQCWLSMGRQKCSVQSMLSISGLVEVPGLLSSPKACAEHNCTNQAKPLHTLATYIASKLQKLGSCRGHCCKCCSMFLAVKMSDGKAD